MKKLRKSNITLFFINLFGILLLLQGCTENTRKEIPLQYDFCSEEYTCESDIDLFYPVRLILPDEHHVVEMDLLTSEAYAFLGNISDALATYSFADMPYGKIGTDPGAIDLVNGTETGLDVIVTGVELIDGVYEGDGIDALASAISGRKLASYMVKVVDYDGNEKKFNIPIGKTTIAVSENVNYIEVRSTIDYDQTKYIKARVKGTIAYENAHEVQIQKVTVDNLIDELSPEAEEKDLDIPEDYSETERPDIVDEAENMIELPDNLPEQFIFSSGAGGWDDVIQLYPNGEFAGEFHDSDMGVCAPEYPNGTLYLCEYRGKFSDIQKLSDYEYSLFLSDIETQGTEGEQRIEDGTLIETTEPYGLQDGKQFTLYLPGISSALIPGDMKEWYRWLHGKDMSGYLENFALYNNSTGYVFWGY